MSGIVARAGSKTVLAGVAAHVELAVGHAIKHHAMKTGGSS